MLEENAKFTIILKIKYQMLEEIKSFSALGTLIPGQKFISIMS